MKTISIGQTADGRSIEMPLSKATRHGLVTGSTGSGKTVTLQRMAEQFSAAGVPVFLSDVKGDLSGISTTCSSALWDIYGAHGLRITTSVQEMGDLLLSSMLKLNEVQAGTLAIALRKAEDERAYLLTLDDLRWQLDDMQENREEVALKYGNITASSIAAIRRQIFALEVQGGDKLFGEPGFDIKSLFRGESADGSAVQGTINLLHADQLMEAPKLYATFLMWLLTEIFRKMPEVGDVAVPRMVFFMDEAHLLFRDAPKPLLEQIERLVRLVRSKGVGVFFVTQSPADIPDAVLAQLGNRIQHCLRAYTPKDQRMVKAAAMAFRQNRALDVAKTVTILGVGEAIVSVLDDAGVPTIAEMVKVGLPKGQIGPISALEREAIIDSYSAWMKKPRSLGSAELQGAEFQKRMLAIRHIEAVQAVQADDWKEGDFRSYIPDIEFNSEPTKPGRLYHLGRLIVWGAIAAGAFSFLKFLM